MSNNRNMASLSLPNWLSSKNKHKDNDLIEQVKKINLRFMEILKRYGFEVYKGSVISRIFKKINFIQNFIYSKSIEYICDLPDYATYDLKMAKVYNLTGILKVNFTPDELAKEANELSLNEVSSFLSKIKFWLPATTLKENRKLAIIIEPIANYFNNPIINKISIAVLVKKKGLFSQPFELTRLSIPFVDQSDYDIENSLRKIILLTKFYVFLDEIKWQLSAEAIKVEYV